MSYQPMNTTRWPKCPKCGLLNIPERTICKRCRADLRPTPIPAPPAAYTDATGALFVSADAHHRLFVNSRELEYRGPGITLRTTWENVDCVRSESAETYLWLAAPAVVTKIGSGDAVRDAWLERAVPLGCFGYPANVELRAHLRRYAPDLWAQQSMRGGQANRPHTLPGSAARQLPQWYMGISMLFIFLPLLMVACIAASSFLSPSASRRGFTIEDTISRANRVIAIDAPDKPLYRWVFTTPEDYTAVTDAGAIAKHDPAQVSYGTGWTNPSPEHSDTVYTDLTDDEWQRVEQWRQTWCHVTPVLRSLKHDERSYIVALRCSGYTATTFRVPQDQLPADIAALLRRASARSISQSPSE